MRWDEVPLLAFDVETTGTDVSADRVVELGAAWFRDGRPVTLHRTLIDPGCPIPPHAVAIHGITDEDVRGQPDFAAAAPRFLEHASGAAAGVGPPYLCGYNALAFDLPIINAELARVGRAERLDATRVIDPMVFVRWYHRGHPRRNLEAMCDLYEVPLRVAHAAASDSAAAGLLLYAMVNRGTIPPDVDEALGEQRQLIRMLRAETARWGHWLYVDRETGELHVGVGRSCGLPLQVAEPEFFDFLLRNVRDLPEPVRALAEERLAREPAVEVVAQAGRGRR